MQRWCHSFLSRRVGKVIGRIIFFCLFYTNYHSVKIYTVTSRNCKYEGTKESKGRLSIPLPSIVGETKSRSAYSHRLRWAQRCRCTEVLWCACTYMDPCNHWVCSYRCRSSRMVCLQTARAAAKAANSTRYRRRTKLYDHRQVQLRSRTNTTKRYRTRMPHKVTWRELMLRTHQ